MGFLGNLVQGLGGGGGKAALVSALINVLQNQQGGIAGLAGAFQQHGLGDVVQSWIGTGANQSISPDQVTQVLGHDQVQQVANEAGVSHEEAKSGIAALLPQLVDHLTPGGQMPQSGDLMSQGMELLKGRLFG